MKRMSCGLSALLSEFSAVSDEFLLASPHLAHFHSYPIASRDVDFEHSVSLDFWQHVDSHVFVLFFLLLDSSDV